MVAVASVRVPTEALLKDIRASEATYIITARIVTVSRREVRRKSDGQRRPVLSGLLSDGTATVPFTWWDPPGDEVEAGSVIRAGPVRAGEFRGRVELSFGWKTQVAPASPAELPTVAPEDLPLRTCAELRPGLEAFRLEARLLESAPKLVTVGTERRQIHEGLVGDRSGVVGFTSWVDLPVRPGDAIRVRGAYVGAYRGRTQLVVDERAYLERFTGEGIPPRDELLREEPVVLGHLEHGPISERVTVTGRAVAVQPPSGLIWRCPQCRRTLREGACRIHGEVTGQPDLRLRLVVDDGTGTITLNLERPETEALTGRTLEECLAQVRGGSDPAVLESQLFLQIFGHRVLATGPVTRDDFGLGMYPRSIRRAGPDPTPGVTAR